MLSPQQLINILWIHGIRFYVGRQQLHAQLHATLRHPPVNVSVEMTHEHGAWRVDMLPFESHIARAIAVAFPPFVEADGLNASGQAALKYASAHWEHELINYAENHAESLSNSFKQSCLKPCAVLV